MSQKRPVLPEKPTLGDLQADIAALVKERGWDNETPTDIMLLMIEEVGELAKEVRKTTHLTIDKTRASTYRSEMAHELADVLNYLMALANAYNINLEQAYRDKQVEVEKRNWS